MSLRESLRVALENLLAHRLRTFLTLLGILISVTTLSTVVSVVRGMDRYISEQVSQLGPDVFVISRFGIITNARDMVRAQKRPDLNRDDYEALRHGVTLASQVGALLSQSGNLSQGGQTVRSSIRGVTPNMIDVRMESLSLGRYLSEADYRHRRQTCVIGQDVAENLFSGRNPVGRTLSLEGHPFLVVGVAKSVGSIFGQSEDNFAYIPLTTAQKLFGQRRSLGFQLKVSDPSQMIAAQDQARLILRTRHHLKYSEEDDFGIISPAVVLELWQELTGTIARVAVVVTLVFLFVGGLVIMNIMLATVSERTWEVGMRKTVGARKSDVRRQFLMESSCLATLGGLLGILLAFVLTQLASRLTPVPAELSWTTAATAVAVAALVGLFFGVYPASRAARLDPIAALRSELG